MRFDWVLSVKTSILWRGGWPLNEAQRPHTETHQNARRVWTGNHPGENLTRSDSVLSPAGSAMTVHSNRVLLWLHVSTSAMHCLYAAFVEGDIRTFIFLQLLLMYNSCYYHFCLSFLSPLNSFANKNNVDKAHLANLVRVGLHICW